MMEYSVRRITDFSKIELLYHKRLKKDFAADELRSLGSLKHSWDLNAYECYELFDGHETVGYAFFVRNSGSFSIKPKRGSDPNQTFYVRFVNSDQITILSA